MLNGKSILITGGTGSLGKHLTKIIYKKWPEVKRLVIFSRDEQKQYQMAQEYPEDKYPSIRFFIGDVRNKARIKRAFENVEIVIHAAAMKHIPIAEYNPGEAILTNIIGAQNVIDAALETKVQKVVALSTDKATAPTNLYGATKLVSDKLFVAANNIKGSKDIRFSVVRYGNVMGSNGSVIPLFMKKRKEGVLPITDKSMTRFNISLDDGVKMVLYAVKHALGGEIFIPKISSFKITDLAKAISPKSKIKVIGIRHGEKLHEEMITETDSYNTIELDDYYIIVPSISYCYYKNDYLKHYNAEPVKRGFVYNSGKNTKWMSVENIREKIKEHLYPDFKPE